MQTSTRFRPSTSAPGDGSRTLTITSDPTREQDEDERDEQEGDGSDNVVGSLRLRGAPKKQNRQRVAWGENVVDNEGCGKKKSKICCIYHKPRRFDESSDESDSSDSDDSSCVHNHDHSSHNHNHQHNGGPSSSNGQQQSRTADPSSTIVHELNHSEQEPNAYERQPGQQKGKRRAA